jgi:hypothetical protein
MKFTISSRWHNPLEIVETFEKYGRLDELYKVYGFLFDSPLNGGRLRKDCITFPLDTIEQLNDRGIGYSFTLTNLTVAREYLEDRHTNEVLKRFENPLNGVIVSNDLIADYIKEKYPGYSLRASCMYNFLTTEEINNACQRFDEVCVFPEVNHQEETLDGIVDKDKLLLFATSICLNKCGLNRLHHYYILGQDHIAWYNHQKYKTPYRDDAFHAPHMPWCKAKSTTPMVHDMEYLAGKGFSSFKITQFELLVNSYFKNEDITKDAWKSSGLKKPGKLFKWNKKRRS